MYKGIEIILNSGDSDNFDPVKFTDGLKEYQDHTEVEISNGYKYNLKNADIKEIRWYDLCQCGYELYDGTCRNYSCSLSID